MQVLLSTDNHIDGTDELTARVEGEVRATLDRFADQITRVEVHLNDTNGPKGGDRDLRCMMEARLSGHQPVAVSCEAASLDEAVTGAAETLEKSLDRLVGKLGQKKGRTPFGGEPAL